MLELEVAPQSLIGQLVLGSELLKRPLVIGAKFLGALPGMVDILPFLFFESPAFPFFLMFGRHCGNGACVL